jgi:hypothetical protein
MSDRRGESRPSQQTLVIKEGQQLTSTARPIQPSSTAASRIPTPPPAAVRAR